MADVRMGRQTPTQSVILPYSETKGPEAIDLYHATGNDLLEWQQLLACDIMATVCGCIKNMDIQCREEMVKAKMFWRAACGG